MGRLLCWISKLFDGQSDYLPRVERLDLRKYHGSEDQWNFPVAPGWSS